ncbi:sigma-70 family RNA polymerase sigma factor [Actinoplanes sp. LDG1-06]|uniref:Sigma-70 family RNA polymerase sigma factor n=1 Tax=Paractinoplanes ovalisporus TaxID=2810368 RepID=A0ABS2AEI8_9ACTN|nr:sigma-70 family RNA polymerase sigma factor [Actinoplanes ovalisporus]MBM2618247.1 sigma-70 family RNA polymerase sigma factor [Actinoplanes ovalisporus]
MEAVARAHRESWSRIVATLIRVTGDWTLAEDCAQDALAVALERWPRDGVPDNPGAWLMTVARNRAIDHLRRAAVEGRKLREVAMTEPGPDDNEIGDDRLRLIFTCCHPALALEARVALTLRTVAGVSTADIARAFLVTESAMTRRITRAKSKISAARIPYRVPEGDALGERLPGVLAVLYLLFNRGYDGEPLLAGEAIRLARLLTELMPGESEVSSLLALFLLQHSRRHARRDEAGELVTLDRQDRAKWDRAAIAEALEILLRTPIEGPYALQARIAACHAADDTDWRSIALWYDELARVQPTAVVELNRAVAHGYAYGPREGLDLLRAISKSVLENYPMAKAVEADLTARAGDSERAAALFREAAAATPDGPERRALLSRADKL